MAEYQINWSDASCILQQKGAKKINNPLLALQGRKGWVIQDGDPLGKFSKKTELLVPNVWGKIRRVGASLSYTQECISQVCEQVPHSLQSQTSAISKVNYIAVEQSSRNNTLKTSVGEQIKLIGEDGSVTVKQGGYQFGPDGILEGIIPGKNYNGPDSLPDFQRMNDALNFSRAKQRVDHIATWYTILNGTGRPFDRIRYRRGLSTRAS